MTRSNEMENTNPLPDSIKLDPLRPHLKFLSDAMRELSALEDTKEMLETYLLTAMGTLGIRAGYVVLIHPDPLQYQLVSRGLDDTELKRFQGNIPEIIRYYFPPRRQKKSSQLLEIHVLEKEEQKEFPWCPLRTEILIQWTIDQTCLGVTGFVEKIRPESYSIPDEEFLLAMTHTLMFSIRNERSETAARSLGDDLLKKNDALRVSLKQADGISKELDRRLFHLKSFYDVTNELINLKSSQEIIQTFLLLMMGIFSADGGYILLFDRADRSIHMAHRGVEEEKLEMLHKDKLERVMTEAFEDAKPHHSQEPTNTTIITDPGLMAAAAFFMELKIGLQFVLNETCIGILGLKENITGQDYSKDDQALMRTLVNHSLVFLGNARSFETIQDLNANLEKRNVKLKKTIEDLRASRKKIEILEAARSRIRTVVQKEVERARRVSPADLLFILCAGLLLGAIYNFSSPNGIDIIPQIWKHPAPARIEVQQAKLRFDAGTAIFVDARPPEFFNRRHIDNAVNLPLAIFDFVYMMKLSNLDPQREIIVYGRNISRIYDEEIVLKLASRGHQNLKVLVGGLNAWEERGYPLKP